MELKELRMREKLTQEDVCRITGMPLRTYKRYENEIEKRNTEKYRKLLETLTEYCRLDETHGVLRYDVLVERCKNVFDNYDIHYAYLLGDYAKGVANERSKIVLLISTECFGLEYYSFSQQLKQELVKEVEMITINQLKDNILLIDELLQIGKKIY